VPAFVALFVERRRIAEETSRSVEQIELLATEIRDQCEGVREVLLGLDDIVAVSRAVPPRPDENSVVVLPAPPP
jgi:hypothetical protein